MLTIYTIIQKREYSKVIKDENKQCYYERRVNYKDQIVVKI